MSEYRKFVVAIIGFLVTALTLAVGDNLIPAPFIPYVLVGISLANAYGVFAVRNGGRSVTDA